LVRGKTELGYDLLTRKLKDIELLLGRTPEERAQGLVRIDLDVLEYDGIRHHLRDWERPYVQDLLPQL
jgi:2-amino-4-hydroxy-6-hydroxymethyldihydropteridine diphosphokinase